MESAVSRASVLLIDAHPERRARLLDALAPLGVHGVEAGSVAHALDLLAPGDFALLVFGVPEDWEQGRREARALVDACRSRGTPLLLLLGERSGAQVREAHLLGAVECFTGELDAEVLRARVSSFVALARRERRLHLMLESSGLGHWTLHLGTMRLEASPGCARNFGVGSPEELASYDALRALIHPEDRSRMAEAVTQTLESRTDYACDYRVVPPAGGVRWVAARGRLECDEQGAPVRMSGITLDITERMRGEEKLSLLAEASRLLGESQEPEEVLGHVARLLASSVATYCVIDLLQEDGALRRTAIAHRDPLEQQHMERVWGARTPLHASSLPAETLRQGWSQLYPDFSAELRQRAAISPEHEQLIARLDPRALLLVPIQGGGRPWGVILLARGRGTVAFDERDVDLVEELARRAAIVLEKAQLLARMRDAVRRRDEFLSVASHELKTPLTPLNLRLQVMERALASGGFATLEQRLPGDVAVMRQQIKRLSELMGELLEVPRLGAGPMPLEREPLELGALVHEGMVRLASSVSRSGCQISVHAPAPVHGHWDRRRLEQVVSHLLSNALKYGAGKPVHLQLGTEQVGTDSARAWLVVRDQGIGIDPRALPRVFEKFERAVSVRHYGGLGLGLYISRRIVESHGGTLHVESSLGEGATFTLKLPLMTPGPPSSGAGR